MSADRRVIDYLLGEMEPGERAEFERLVDDDPAMRREVERMRVVVSGLEELPPEAWGQAPVPPLAGLPPPAATPRRPRRQLTLRPLGAAVAALALLAAGAGVGALVAGRDDEGSRGRAIVLAPLERAAGPVGGTARTVSSDGAGLRVEVHGLAPSRGGAFYELWLLDGPGRMVAVGSFRVPESGRATVTVPLPADPAGFRYVDVSAEPGDGDPGHSGRSVLRGSTS